MRFAPQGDKEHGLYSPASIHPPPCTYTYLGTRDPPQTASRRGSSPLGLQPHLFRGKKKSNHRNPMLLDSRRYAAFRGKTRYTHATLRQVPSWIYRFVPADSETCIRHDTTPPSEYPTSTDLPPCSKDLLWWNRRIVSSNHGACSRPHPDSQGYHGSFQTRRTHHHLVQACS